MIRFWFPFGFAPNTLSNAGSGATAADAGTLQWPRRVLAYAEGASGRVGVAGETFGYGGSWEAKVPSGFFRGVGGENSGLAGAPSSLEFGGPRRWGVSRALLSEKTKGEVSLFGSSVGIWRFGSLSEFQESASGNICRVATPGRSSPVD